MKLFKILLLPIVLGLFSLPVFADPVNINTADVPTLAKNLKGIGPKAASAIVAYRKQHGAFKRADDLARVKGIGLKTVAKNRANILVSSK